jgi:hypothetical protein
MYIKLPEKFIFTDKAFRTTAYVKDGILYVSSSVNVEDLMYTLAYLEKGYNSCYYCGGKLTNTNRSIDHMFPVSWGGVTVSPNLVPCCKSCNNKKTNMTHNQYIRWKKCGSQKQKDKYYREAVKKNRKTACKVGFVLPQSWTVMYDVTNVLSCMNFPKGVGKKKLKKVVDYYEEYHVYPNPIVVTSNGWVLKGLHILYHAKMHDISEVPAIILENVVKV